MQFANLKWNNNQPYSLDFDDIYYSSDDGLAETEHVFIQHNQLKERFKHLHNSQFTITETGFGTGLNFLLAAKTFIDHAPKNATLRYITIERFPLQIEDLIKSHQHWPIFGELALPFHSVYHKLQDGLNIFRLNQDRIHLDLWIGDVSECLPKIITPANAWFLDGFAPAKNSDMWSEALFHNIGRLSIPNTTFATFTSAGQVRRSLQAAGFNVSKVAGFGKKREMLRGTFD